MERVKIEAQIREKSGKEKAKKIRQAGNVPAIVYGRGANTSLELPLKSFKILKHMHFSRSAIIDMEVTGTGKKEEFSTLIKDIQYHPVTEAVIHFDFLRVSLEEKIKVTVPIVLKGDAQGVKDGGILAQQLWNLVIEVLPLEIPEKFEVDVTNLKIGDSVHVSSIKVSDNIRVISAATETVAGVVEKQEEKVEEVAAAEAAPTGPEVIKKEKEEGEEGEEGEAKPEKAEAAPKEEPKKKADDKKKEK